MTNHPSTREGKGAEVEQGARGTLCSRQEPSALEVSCLVKAISYEAADSGGARPAAPPSRRFRPHHKLCGPAHLHGPHLRRAHSVALSGATARELRGRPPPQPGGCTDRGGEAKHSHPASACTHMHTSPLRLRALPTAQPFGSPAAPGASREL